MSEEQSVYEMASTSRRGKDCFAIMRRALEYCEFNDVQFASLDIQNCCISFGYVSGNVLKTVEQLMSGMEAEVTIDGSVATFFVGACNEGYSFRWYVFRDTNKMKATKHTLFVDAGCGDRV